MNKFSESVVYPIPPRFDKDDNLDVIHRYLSWLHDRGARVVMTTAGTSRFNLLHENEIAGLNTMVNQFEGTSILGMPVLSSKHLKRFIVKTSVTGKPIEPDAILVTYPDRYYSDDDIVSFFNYVAELSPWPVMFHGMFMRNGKGGLYQYSVELCDKIKRHRNIVGMKEESLDLNRAYEISKLASDDFTVIPAGGSCRRYILCAAAGAQTFLGGIGNIFPIIEESFFLYMKEKRFELAYRIVEIFEDPFMEIAKEIGWHKFLQESLQITGLMKSYNRLPFSKVTMSESNKVRIILELIQEKLEDKAAILCRTPGSSDLVL